MIGSADGTQYETMTQYALSLHPEGKENGPITSEIKPDKSKQPQPMTDPDMWKEPGYINQDHHVPLVASAIMDQDGKMMGMAVDHRLNLSDDDKGLLHLHESTELPWMQDLMKAGYSPQDAYHEAHDHATARETAASIAKWGEDGHEQYKQRMRDNTAIAAEPSDRERHPDAHTTRYGLDQIELASNFKPINPMQPSYTNPGGHEKDVPAQPLRAAGGWRGNPNSLKNLEKGRNKGVSKTFTNEELGILKEVMPYVSDKVAARILDKDPQQIRNAVFRHKIETGMKYKPFTEEEKETVEKMFSEGKSLREIGRAIDRPHTSFRHLLPDVPLQRKVKDWWEDE